MRLNFLRFAVTAGALGLLSTVGAGAAVRMNPVHPIVPKTVVHPAPAGIAFQPRLISGKIYPVRPLSASCPSSYVGCLELPPGTKTTLEWCVISSTSSTCTSGPYAPGTWKWKGKSADKKVVKAKKFSPNPGNPTEESIVVSSKAKEGKVYGVTVSVKGSGSCKGISSGSCGPFSETFGVIIGSSS
jgi:hypothetical protein